MWETFDYATIRFALAAYENSSMRRAAMILEVGPSAVSRRVRKLEDELGVSLFERFNGGVRSTLAGKRFFERARLALVDLDYAIKSAGSAGRGVQGSLRIGIFASIASGFAYRALQSFRTQYPQVELEIIEGSQPAHLRQIRQRKLDLAFLTGSHDLLVLDSEVLWTESVDLVLPRNHPLARLPTISWSDVQGERFIVSRREPGPEIHDWLIARLGGLGKTTEIVRCPVGRESLFIKVGLGLGLSVVSHAGTGVHYPNVVFRPIGEPDEVIPFSAVWSPTTDNPALRRFLSVMRAMASGRSPPPVD